MSEETFEEPKQRKQRCPKPGVAVLDCICYAYAKNKTYNSAPRLYALRKNSTDPTVTDLIVLDVRRGASYQEQLLTSYTEPVELDQLLELNNLELIGKVQVPRIPKRRKKRKS